MAPVPFGWKLCFIVSPKAICLTVNVLGEALVLAELVLAELELEHPAVPSSPAVTTVAPSQAAVRMLKMFTDELYAIRVTYSRAEPKAQLNGAWREEVQVLKIWSTLVNAPLGKLAGSVLRSTGPRQRYSIGAGTHAIVQQAAILNIAWAAPKAI